MSEKIKDVLNSTFFLVDAAFFLALGIALNADTFRNQVVKYNYLLFNKYEILDGVKNPIWLGKTLDEMTPRFTYNVIKFLLYFSLSYNLLCMFFIPGAHPPLLNLIYTLYSLSIANTSAYDILLDDDKKVWSYDVKRRHVFFPINMDDIKVFKQDLSTSNMDLQVQDTRRYIITDTANFLAYFVGSVFFYRFLYDVPFIAFAWVPLMAHREFLRLLNRCFELFTLVTFHNKYEPQFGDIMSVIDEEKHESFGRQYQYFLFFGRPIENVLYNQVFMRIRKMGGTVGEAKAVTYLTRGVLFNFLLFIINGANFNFTAMKNDGDLTLYFCIMCYYSIHAVYAYSIDGTKDFFDKEILRNIMARIEGVMSGLLFYKPIMCWMDGKFSYNV